MSGARGVSAEACIADALPKEPLITLAHGSRHPLAGRGIEELTAAAGRIAGRRAVAAHLEFTEPSLLSVARELASAGHRSAVVVPLLFTDAFHQRFDVPRVVAEAEEQTGLRLRIARGLGTGRDVARVVARRVREPRTVLYHVGSSQPGADDTVVELAREVGDLAGHEVRSVSATTGGGVEWVARQLAGRHVVPLFVTDGLLLDRARAVPGARVDPPFTAELAALVAERAGAALR